MVTKIDDLKTNAGELLDLSNEFLDSLKSSDFTKTIDVLDRISEVVGECNAILNIP